MPVPLPISSARGYSLVDRCCPSVRRGIASHVEQVAAVCRLPVIRYERRPVPSMMRVVPCVDYADAMRRMEADGGASVGSNLVSGQFRNCGLSGSGTIVGFGFLIGLNQLPKPKWLVSRVKNCCSITPTSPNPRFCRQVRPDAVLTKESGVSGRFACQDCGRTAGRNPRLCRPAAAAVPIHSIVSIPTGLLRRIDELLPEFFVLRSGYTTERACAAPEPCGGYLRTIRNPLVTVILPGGERVALPVERLAGMVCRPRLRFASDAGDDPDVTNGCAITARVELNDCGAIRFLQGRGRTLRCLGLGLSP